MAIRQRIKCLFKPQNIKHKQPIETYYLIDFENVHEDGLICSKRLTQHDHIHIFSTTNAPKISLEKLASFNYAEQFSHVIPAGKQSLDMHLVSYLGYLIGSSTNNRCKYIIISRDTDYDNVISFFKTIAPLNIKRQNSMSLVSKPITINNAASTQVAANKPALTHAQVSANNTSSTKVTNNNAVGGITVTTTQTNNKATSASENKTQLNSNIQKTVSKAGFDNSIVNKVASIVSKHYGKDKFANNIHNELRATYPDIYSDIYKIIKPLINKAPSTATTNQNNITQSDNEIQNTLSNANYNKDTVSYVTSLVIKHRHKSNAKQNIYQAITAKYGQAKGLKIYNHIKKKI
ncbi:MAG: hypothetical protein HDR03_11025 [Lachnospiraceae bacterium]|nr:hypothetical protein [Lachnospiraceae bacterium]